MMTHLKTMGVMVLVIVAFYIAYTYPVFIIKVLIALFIMVIYGFIYKIIKNFGK